MGIKLTKIIDNRATPITYWRYIGLSNINNLEKFGLLVFGGYTSEEIRNDAEAATRAPDFYVSFKVNNRDEIVADYRPYTLDEKKAFLADKGFSEQEIIDYQINMTIQKIIPIRHFDEIYLEASKSVVTGDSTSEKALAYKLINEIKEAKEFFAGGVTA